MLDARGLQGIVEVQRCTGGFRCESRDRIVAGLTYLLPQPEIDGFTRKCRRGYFDARSRNPEAVISLVGKRHMEILHKAALNYATPSWQ